MERLLKTKYKLYEHSTGQHHIACDEYSVPRDIAEHIDLIMPTVHFDTKIVGGPEHQNEKRDIPTNLQPGNPGSGFLPKKGKTIKGPGAQPNAAEPFALTTCNTQITPECLRALYQFPNGTLAKSSYGIVEYTPQAYLQGDLDLFYSNLARTVPAGTAPTLNSIDGGVVQTTTQGFNVNGESDLDLEYAIALGMQSPFPVARYMLMLMSVQCIHKRSSCIRSAISSKALPSTTSSTHSMLLTARLMVVMIQSCM